MTQNLTYRFSEWFRRHEKLTLALLALVFILLRLPGTSLPLHQDEYKWPLIVNPAHHSEVSIPHPPLSQFIYRTAGYIVGFNTHFRFVPLFFGVLNLLLMYYFMCFAYGRKEALIASVIWIFSYFSILASLMVDTDGEIMPFFFLLALIGYFKTKETYGTGRYKWIVLLVLACTFGFFIKVSFLLSICAIALDFVWSKKGDMKVLDILKYIGFAVLGLIGLALLLLVAHSIFPFFDLKQSLTYWEHFWTGNRNWFQTMIQCAKALLYTSPFLLFVPLLATKKVWEKTKVFLFFILGALFFYVILFDFSLGALDRYFQFLILPLTVICAVTIGDILKTESNRKTKQYLFFGIVVALVFVLLQSLPHFVPPLHPKSEWITRALSLRWNFVYPFSGGSGPLGFYVSFLFMALMWIGSAIAVCFALYKRSSTSVRVLVLAFLIPLGFAYNVVFAEEYLIGFWNGSAPHLLSHAVEYIAENPDIKMVTVYNDNGGNEIQEIGKYRKRLYVDPKFDINEKIATLNQYKEHYFVLDVPRIDPTSVYQKYFDTCIVAYKETDQKISAIIYDCRYAPDVHL